MQLDGIEKGWVGMAKHFVDDDLVFGALSSRARRAAEVGAGPPVRGVRVASRRIDDLQRAS